MGFQTACAILQLIRTPEEYPEAKTFRVEGADEAIDFEVRDAQGRPLLLAQAKTRIEPGSWSGLELVRLARRWGAADPGGTAVLRFLSDAPVHSSGYALRNAVARARAVPDPDRWLAECKGEVPASIGLTASDHALLRRLEIDTRIGPWEQILDQARLELLRLSPVAMAAGDVDSTVDALFVKTFQWSGDHLLARRTVRLDELPGLLRGRRAAPGAEAFRLPGPVRALFREVPSAAGVRGRGRELATLRARFSREPDAGTVRMVMSGLGGIGKSSIARLYAHRHRDKYDFVWWIPSDTREDVIAAYRRMVAEERQETEPATDVEILTQVGLRLAHLGNRLLLVYDNVADREQLQGLLPACEGAHVLVTTRDSAWAAADGGLVIERMRAEEAAAWAGERLPDISESEVSALVDAVEGIPLGIAQAIGYIAATQCPVSVYLTELADCRAKLLDDPGFIPLDYREGATLTAAVTLSLGKVLDQALHSPEGSGRHIATGLLARCALLAPDFIPLRLATLDLPTGSAVYGAVAELRRFSLVDPRDGVLAIHRIVQEVVRAMLDNEAVDMMQGRFQHELVKRLVDCQKQHTWVEAATLIEHAVHVAHRVTSSGHADADTVALLANVAGAISNIHGDLVRSEELLREALEIVKHASEGAIDDPVYRRAATTTTLAQCLMNQSRFDEAAQAARIAWNLLEGMDTLDAEGVEHLLLAHVADMRAAVATDRFADIARANARLETVLQREDVTPSTALGIRLEQVQSLVWIQNWDDAAMAIDQAKAVAPADAETNAELHFLDAIVKASTGRLEEALAVTAGIPEPAERAAVSIMRHHADHMVDAAHALMVGGLHRQKKGLPTDTWILQAAESLIDQAEALLVAHTEAGPDVLAHVMHRRAVLAWTRHLLGHSDGDPDLCRALMRESLELFEAAGQSHVPLAVTARQFLELHKQDSHDEPPETVSLDGPPHVPLPPSGGSGTYLVSEYPWRSAVALNRAVPPDARSLYSLLGATLYHLSGQAAPSPAFLVLAFATALRALGLKCRLIPTTLRVTRGDGESLDLTDWQLPPMVMKGGEIRGHITVWCEEAARLVDPALLLGQSRFAPDAAEREIFRAPVVMPAPDLSSLLGISPATHREGHLLAYEFRLDWEERLRGAIEHLDETAVASFARVLSASAILAAATDPHI
ncbi:NB-ARC domain-containing protein [Streptomyces atratus]|uniref:NB-ARC domain-containing protein n=1 Tax=Streptomyces atratus TaxID=1893 RepID=UPI00225A8DFA|nr:NB-ARC domain-containing protein [Streptomyces atratus]MCX5341145.1 NB-ARC domain-containing protein [Streptomyces atratus]